MQRRKSKIRKPTRTRREKIPNYRKLPRRPCRNSMKCVTYKTAIRTNPGGADAHMRTHDREIEVPAVVPSHRCVENGLTTVKIARLSQKAGGCRVRVDACTKWRCRKSGKGAAERDGKDQCEQLCGGAWKIRENPNTKREERIR